MITQERLKEVVVYNEHTGTFIWSDCDIRVTPGSMATDTHPTGYLFVRIKGKHYLAHRLAFLYMTGDIPKEVDHVNRDQADNRWVNLRSSTRSQNAANSTHRKDNTSGYRGVYACSNSDKWEAQIRYNKKLYHLGRFDCPAIAHETYKKKHIEFFGAFSPYLTGES